jgi:hypothetical protein
VAFNSGQCRMSPLPTSRNLSACFKPAHPHKRSRDELALPDLIRQCESGGEKTVVANRSNRCMSAVTLHDSSDRAVLRVIRFDKVSHFEKCAPRLTRGAFGLSTPRIARSALSHTGAAGCAHAAPRTSLYYLAAIFYKLVTFPRE